MRFAAIAVFAAVGITLTAGVVITMKPPTAEASAPTVAQASPKSIAPGLGNSKAAPVGASFSLPDGITLENPIVAHSAEDPVDCDDKYPEGPDANGGAVAICLVFRNQTNTPIEVKLPPGLMFVSRSDKVQSGFLVQTVTIRVPPGERFVSPLFLHCANGDRNLSSRGDEYELGPILQGAAFQELFDLLEGKEVGREDLAFVQLAVRHLTNNEGLSAADRAALQAM